MNHPKKSKHTTTNSFGSKGRIAHDASRFYNSRLYEGLETPEKKRETENPFPETCINKILTASSTDMKELPDACVHLMITSPPYNASKDYDKNLSLDEYRQLLSNVWQETWRVLVPGGRACINIANLGRKPYIPLHSLIIEDMLKAGFLMRGEIIWNKASSCTSSTAWGSWCSASNPVLRDIHEYILVFSKAGFKRSKKNTTGESTIERDDFLEWTKSVWTIPTESARKIGHPAPFPLELPHRLIQLYSFEQDIVLDPFAGSGTTCLAALQDNRRYIAYEINPEYVALADQRIKEYMEEINND